MMKSESIKSNLEEFKEEQEPILNQVDNAIALFNRAGKLVLFNQKLLTLWDLERNWLQKQPHFEEVFARVMESGYWSHKHRQRLHEAYEELHGFSFSIEQINGISLQADMTVTKNGGRLLILRDITKYQRSQASLEAEVKRLRFLLGLTERLQAGGDLQEIGQFALTYLVRAMNSAFGDVKVVRGEGSDRYAGPIVNRVAGEFLATYGKPVVADMQGLLERGIPYGQGLLWEVVETGEPVFVEDYRNHPKAVPGFRHPGIGQLGIFPIPATTGRIIGVLTLESRSLQKLQEAPQQDMLLAACQMLGAAIERAEVQENLRKTNQDLERASELKSEFLASMSHELRTPLNSILGFADLLQREIGGSLNPRQINHVKAIEKSGQHLLALINEILDLSKIEVGKVELNLNTISIHDLCTSCLKMLQPRADKKRLALSLELDDRLSLADLDERRVRQMLVNLLSNATKFTPEGGKVKLSGRLALGKEIEADYRPDCSTVNPSTPYLCLEVIDSGIGIPEEKWSLLFQPFQQVDSSLTRRHEGTGLGLALTKRLAELHGGTVSFQSVPEVGSTFRVWLPIAEMFANASALEKQNSVGSSKETGASKEYKEGWRILVLEDQPSNQVLVTELLESEGYALELICDGESMLQAIYSPLVSDKSLPDLILMDIQLPEVDGFELMRHIKAHPLWQQVPIIAVTAMAMPGDSDRCLAAGAAAYLSKPLDLDLVLSSVKSLLESNSLSRIN